MAESRSETPDSYVHERLDFEAETLRIYVRSLRLCEGLLDRDLKALDDDEALREILGADVRKTLPLERFSRELRRCREWLEQRIQEAVGGIYAELDITHGRVRLIKSAVMLYVADLQQRRDAIARRPNVSRYVLQAVDQKLTEARESVNVGVVGRAQPFPILMDQLLVGLPVVAEQTRSMDSLANVPAPRPFVVESIEILDDELRERCLDLLERFREDGQHERLDTVVTEATRVLEDRLRILTRAEPTTTGVELAKHAFGDRRLIVSHVGPEQDAAHLLFRGVFGFIRNSVHHRLIRDLQPERVLQIVGFMDYLLSIAVAAAQSGGSPKAESPNEV